MYYNGRQLQTLLVYPQVSDAIAVYREENRLPPLPVSELGYGLDEVMEVRNQLDAELLTGKRCTVIGLLDMLKQPFDIFWVLSHGVEEGWFLNDGLVTASETTSLVRSSGIFLTVLNTCSSYQVADAAAQELGTAFVCSLHEVPDRQAFLTGALFARHLAEGLDYVTAWSLAKPGQTHPYILIQARGELIPVDRRHQIGNPNSIDLTTLKDSIAEMQRIVYGSPHLGLPPLREVTVSLERRLAEMQVSLDNIRNSVAVIEANQKERNRYFIGILIILISILFFLAYQQWGGG